MAQGSPYLCGRAHLLLEGVMATQLAVLTGLALARAGALERSSAEGEVKKGRRGRRRGEEWSERWR